MHVKTGFRNAAPVMYRRDFVQRLNDAGFQVSAAAAFGKEAVRFGLIMGDKIFLCSKQVGRERSSKCKGSLGDSPIGW